MTTTLNMRIDADFKAEMEEFFEDIGLNMTTAIMCFLKKTHEMQEIPFKLGREIKAKRMREAIEEAERIARDPNTPRCTDPAKLEEFLFS